MSADEERAQGKSSGNGGGAEGGLPQVDFSGFVLGIGQMALMHLGELPDPVGGEPKVDIPQARHAIDLLDMLELKTQGNLTDEESKFLKGLTKELKIKFVKVAG